MRIVLTAANPKALRQLGHMAERVGFEPTSRLRSLRFSRPVQSTALPPLRSNQFSGLSLFYQAANTDPVPGVPRSRDMGSDISHVNSQLWQLSAQHAQT